MRLKKKWLVNKESLRQCLRKRKHFQKIAFTSAMKQKEASTKKGKCGVQIKSSSDTNYAISAVIHTHKEKRKMMKRV